MNRRDLSYLLQSPTFSGKNVAKKLGKIAKDLDIDNENPPSDDEARKNIHLAAASLAQFLIDWKFFAKAKGTAFEFEPAVLSEEMQQVVRDKLK